MCVETTSTYIDTLIHTLSIVLKYNLPFWAKIVIKKIQKGTKFMISYFVLENVLHWYSPSNCSKQGTVESTTRKSSFQSVDFDKIFIYWNNYNRAKNNIVIYKEQSNLGYIEEICWEDPFFSTPDIMEQNRKIRHKHVDALLLFVMVNAHFRSN